MSIVDLAAEKLDRAKRYGHYVVAMCPFHEGYRPNLFVYEDYYVCKSCGAHGTPQQLERRLSNLPERVYYGQRTESSNPFTRWIREWGISRTIEIAKRNNSKGSIYLLRRGIGLSVQQSLSIGKIEGFLTFPIYNHWKELVGAVARVGENNTSSAKYWIPKGQDPKLLYVPSWEKIKSSSRVYCTFGIIDAISLHIMGLASCSTTTGQSISSEAFKDIRKKIIFVPDELEMLSAYKIANRIGLNAGVQVLSYPYGTKDISDWYIKDRQTLELALCL